MKIFSIGFLVCLMTVGTAFASESMITFNNEMTDGIKAIYCATDLESNGAKISGPLSGESSTKISENLLSSECMYLSVLTDSGDTWKFFHVSGGEAVYEVSLSWSSPNPNSAPDQFHPSLFIKPSDTNRSAGLPLGALVQTLESGITEAQWSQVISPIDTAKFVMSVGDSSWSLLRAPQYAEFGPGENFVSLVPLIAPLHSSTLEEVLTALKDNGFEPAEGSTWETVRDEALNGSIIPFRGDGIVHVQIAIDKEKGTFWMEIQRGEDMSVG